MVSQKKTLVGLFATTCVNYSKDEVVMVTLPLYHSSALVIGLGGVIGCGESMRACPAAGFYTLFFYKLTNN